MRDLNAARKAGETLTPFQDGDVYSYISVTQGYRVVWKRIGADLWMANDHATRGVTTDDQDILEALQWSDD